MKPVIGILAHRVGNSFMDRRFLADLIREGRKLGAEVYAFAHWDLLENNHTVRGFAPDQNGKWTSRNRPWPDIVIDFCRKLYKPFRDMRRRKDLFPYANHKFTYKWKAMKLFAENEKVGKWIPETRLYSAKHLQDMLRKHPIVYVKPGNGTGGHSILKIARVPEGFRLQGRRKSGSLTAKRLSSFAQLKMWSGGWVRSEQIRSGKFMVQQGLDLRLLGQRLVDCRLLIQKNGSGEWEVTGKVLRVGGPNSPTTNLLYRNGKALRFREFLEQRFGREAAERIDRECDELAHSLMDVIEERFGSMIEFGLDIGIDVSGQVWLIEVNPKPSHSAFLHARDPATYRTSIRRPIQYAISLAK